MRVLVTGGSGFLGSAFVHAAIAAGHRVAVLSRSERPLLPPGTRLLTGSIENVPWDQIDDFTPDTCVHAAWIATPGVYLESLENHAWVTWSQHFLARAIGSGVQHIVALGTCIEYQMTGEPLHEDATTVAPLSVYARCKHESHCQLRPALAECGITLSWARVFYPYGEGEHPARLASSLITRMRTGQTVELKTPQSVKDYIHVADTASALLSVAEQKLDGAVNLGTGSGVAVETIARRIAELVGRPDLVRVPENPVADPLDFVVADSSRLRSLGWSPKVSLNSGLQRLMEAHRS